MPLAKTCLDCGEFITPDRTRCSRCQSEKDRKHNSTRGQYRTPEWRRRSKRVTANGCQVVGMGLGPCEGSIVAHHVFNVRQEDGWEKPAIGLCSSHHSRYEADVRAGKETELRRTVDQIGGRT